MTHGNATQETYASPVLELAHELQTPLTVLKCRIGQLRTGMVRDTPAESDVAQIDALIDSIAARITELILSATGARASTIAAPFSLSTLVQEIAEEAAVVAEARTIKLLAKVATNIMLTGNARAMREAVQNLLGNALKYMGDGRHREIRVSLTRTQRNAILTITDTGVGITAKDLPHIFERHFRGQQRYGQAPGIGIGLSVVKRAVEEHGGSICVSSTPGIGTRFFITFPLHRTNA